MDIEMCCPKGKCGCQHFIVSIAKVTRYISWWQSKKKPQKTLKNCSDGDGIRTLSVNLQESLGRDYAITLWYNDRASLDICEMFADASFFHARCKGKNTKTNKIIIVKNRKLATQNFPLNMHIHFPFGNIKRLSLLRNKNKTKLLR
jgi:hypothetical protein